ncbi:SpvB/TcaC N-terminal domain-containing protein [Morganella morganii]|nr:SpvB/TcaC N-terminal domain-containing protein [Morganella morganii]
MRRYPLRGEQIYYRYSNEDNEGCSEDEIRFHPKQSYRYPEKICYGNKKERAPFSLCE